MSLVQKNLDFLKADSKSSPLLAPSQESPIYFEFEKPYSKAFFKTAEKSYPLQSLRKPSEEADRIAKHWLPESNSDPGIYVLVGITNLHFIIKCLERLNDNSELVIVEPSSAIAHSFISNNDLEVTAGYKTRLSLFCPVTDDPVREFRILIKDRDLFCKSTFITPANKRFRSELCELQKGISKQIQLEGMDRVTTAQFADEWLQNCIINLPETVQSPGINSLFKKFSETDCMIVCAGPSLNDSLDLIKERQKDCFIISVGTALKPLLKYGIQPNLTIIVDSDPKVYKQFQGLEQIPGYLLATHTIFPAIFQHFKKSYCYDCVASQSYSEWLSASGISHGTLNVGGTVALSALDCAHKLGFRNSFIFGLDLAYAEDGTSHAKNSMYDGHKANFGLVEILGNWNKTVKTTKQFANYVEILKGYMKDYIAGSSGKFFNVNNYGAHIEGLQTIKPLDSKAPIQKSNQDFEQILNDHFINNNVLEIDELCQESINELNDIHLEAKELLTELEEGHFPEGLELFEDKIKNSAVNTNLTGPAMQAWCMSVTTNFENDPIEMTKSFLTQLTGSTEWVSGLLKNSYERFQKINKGVQYGA